MISPFENVSILELRIISENLKVKNQIIAAFRLNRVIPESVPDYFMKELADFVGWKKEELASWLTGPALKGNTQKVTLERLLRDSLANEEEISTIMKEREDC